MSNCFLKITVLFAVVFAVNGKGSEFYERFMTKRATAPAAGGAAGGKGKESFVFQSPHSLGHGYGGYGGGYGGYGGGYGGWGLHGHGYGNLGHIHPVPVTGVKALSVAYDPISGVPYVCDPNKKADAAGGAKPAAGGAAPATGKRSDIKKDEIKVKIPDYPPCPDPKKSFPWSCLLGGKSSKREECARAKKAVKAARKRYWPAMAGFFPPVYGFPGYGVPFGYAPVPIGFRGRFLG